MDKFSIEEALDCMQSIYKVQYKTIVANVTTQVVEPHLVRGLDKLFSPLEIIEMTDQEVEVVASEQPATQKQRLHNLAVFRCWKKAVRSSNNQSVHRRYITLSN
jgi:hypothetical protein